MNSNDTRHEIDLGGQVAIVSGGGRGIGHAVAQALADAGASVAVVARTEAQLTETVRLIEEAGGVAVAYPADVTGQAAVARMVTQVERELGPVDLLVNNAGVAGPIGLTWEVDAEEWWRCVDVNLRGPFLCSRAVLPGMIARRRGRIATTASKAARWAVPHMSTYAASKAAVVRLSENLAVEAGEHGISAFAICPGVVRTAMSEAVAGSSVFGSVRKLLDEGKSHPPQLTADLVVFLASGQADALSGCFISVDDDVADMVSRAEEIRQDGLYTLRLRT